MTIAPMIGPLPGKPWWPFGALQPPAPERPPAAAPRDEQRLTRRQLLLDADGNATGTRTVSW